MTVTTMEILGSDGAKNPILPLDVEWDTGVALYAAHRWPVGRRKAVAREWGLSEDEARAVVDGNASKRVLSKIWKHPRGGWAVALPVMGAVIGQPVHEFFRRQITDAAKEAERAEEHERLARAAYRRLASNSDDPGAGRDGAASAREARGFSGAVGTPASRRLD